VNGERVQNSDTSDMIFSIRTIVSYVSQFVVLMPGDLITTGTPPGVGLGMKPERYLKRGDTVRLSVEGLGTQTQRVV
jgi:2-keto-4-pentenoate hydratase/2-oxohepta-3-ene-1,7-dioic acid hydratase in catechol pathway